MAPPVNYEYRYFDSVLYRIHPEEAWIEGYLGGKWDAIVPSRADYEHMRPVSAQEAAELKPGAVDGAELD